MDQLRDDTGVIKIGTDVITTSEGHLDRQRMRQIVDGIMRIRQSVSRSLVVTSGAMAAGRAEMRQSRRADETVSERQMYASVGQGPLMNAYRHFFLNEGVVCGQVLLTPADFNITKPPYPYKNVSNTLEEMLLHDVLPVINENDTVATVELTIGDNDRLAASIARMMQARILILLTSVNGLLRTVEDPESVIPKVNPVTDNFEQYLHSGTSGNGTGGMKSKCNVAAEHAKMGGEAYIANGKNDQVLRRMGSEGISGTHFSLR